MITAIQARVTAMSHRPSGETCPTVPAVAWSVIDCIGAGEIESNSISMLYIRTNCQVLFVADFLSTFCCLL